MSETQVLMGIVFFFFIIAGVALGGWRRAMADKYYWKDKAEGTQCDLDYAVEVCFKRGATEFVRLNYPKHFARLYGRFVVRGPVPPPSESFGACTGGESTDV